MTRFKLAEDEKHALSTETSFSLLVTGTSAVIRFLCSAVEPEQI